MKWNRRALTEFSAVIPAKAEIQYSQHRLELLGRPPEPVIGPDPLAGDDMSV
jgi:hypothetical protein